MYMHVIMTVKKPDTCNTSIKSCVVKTDVNNYYVLVYAVLELLPNLLREDNSSAHSNKTPWMNTVPDLQWFDLSRTNV